jgi:hypothetical protein
MSLGKSHAFHRILDLQLAILHEKGAQNALLRKSFTPPGCRYTVVPGCLIRYLLLRILALATMTIKRIALISHRLQGKSFWQNRSGLLVPSVAGAGELGKPAIEPEFPIFFTAPNGFDGGS